MLAIALAASLLGLALYWFWPTLSHGLRSDDYLILYYRDRFTGAVHWGRVFEEFVRGWFGVEELYRPLVSVSFGANYSLWPSPLGFHLGNVLLTAVTAIATASTAGRLLRGRMSTTWLTTLAAFSAGALVVLHPATIEPTAWIAGRTGGLQLAFGSVACWLFVRHLDGAGARWPYLLALTLSLASKEGAVLLPLCFIALDLLHAPIAGSNHTGVPGNTSNERASAMRRCLHRHLPGLSVLALYLAYRWFLLGRLGPASADATIVDRVHNLSIRATYLFAPLDGQGQRHAYYLLWLAIVPALYAGLGRRALVLPCWAVLLLAASTHMSATWSAMIGRLMFDAVPVLAIAMALAIGHSGTALLKVATMLGATAVFLSLATSSSNWLACFETQNLAGRAVERELASVAATATPTAPFACTGMPMLPVFHQKLWGVLAMAPIARRDLSVIGLPELLVRDNDSPESFADAAPVHAIQANGGRVASWHGTEHRFQDLAKPLAGTVALHAQPNAPHEFLVEQPWPGSSVAAIHVELEAPASVIRLRLLDDFPGERAFPWQTANGAAGDVWFDTSHAMAPMFLAQVGAPFRGVYIEVDGSPPPANTRVQVHGTLQHQDLVAPIVGRQMTAAELFPALSAPPGDGPLRIYLMLPTGVRCADVARGDLTPPTALVEHVEYAHELFGPLTVHWFWQGRQHADGAIWRTPLDWAQVVRRD